MSASARHAVLLDLLRFPSNGTLFPGRRGGPGVPVIVDVRGALSKPPLRQLILEEMAFPLTARVAEAEVIAGVAHAGVSWAAMLAQRMGMPAAIVNLDGPRSSGLQREVEGDVDGRNLVLIDNLIARGGSLRLAAEVASRAGARVVGAMTVVADPGAILTFPVHSLWSQRELIDAAFDVDRIDRATHRRLSQKEIENADYTP